ncbi:MAG TPA: tRNA (N6-threonylcarbamoyladenosine(37)-N6)-methyltransferase TrmO [Plasticicumulans sp.]|uniref:tRNA (N6-threonylcarbamoyladenosine(37)-N6)-methyltransferase TrmO n=1 Tax=Plasticicumulans sp. TaxID=2307179 RepID=UPI002C548A4C|nr:tRNA (N6-threonylcarbamoyladenosine(37)-N6)-methyltransferase TrmO [Plasticicumulans sp.]HNG49987.1 tRNA (N6-threonylcarbamoyladenosine(37)-N6)-methyltransferase TrmO [Plasticicumulans sp.]
MSTTLTPVGTLHSPYREKFAIPRQPGLARLPAVLELLAPFDRPEAVRGLDGFSHVWLIFGFHATAAAGWKPTVRPPRLGGNTRLGVFATRSTFRPNPLGLSVVELAGIRCAGGVFLDLLGADLLDGTPVYDVKPYLPYADAIPGARAGFAPEPPARLAVTFAPAAAQVLAAHPEPRLREWLIAVLALDPRPAYRAGEDGEFGVRLFEFDVRAEIRGGQLTVRELRRAG